MKRVVYKETIIGKSWENKIDHFVAKMETKFPMDDKSLINELANNIMIRDMIFDVVFGVSEKEKEKLFKQMNEMVQGIDKESEL